MSKVNKLNEKQRIFVREYLLDKNSRRAAIAAGYTEKSAHVAGNRLLNNDKVAKAIQDAVSKQCERLEIKSDEILRELLRLASVDIAEVFDDMGQMRPLNEIPKDVRKAISSIEVNEIFDGQGPQKSVIGLAKKIKFWDKPRALELLCKHLGLLKEKIEVTGKDGAPIAFIALPENGSESPDYPSPKGIKPLNDDTDD